MPKLPVLSGRDVIKVLGKAGWAQARIKGSHVILVKMVDDCKIALVVPLHKEVDKGTLLEIIRQARLTREEFLNLV
jgi:predicted RNA binding protein YcfA (HicA-like mRNA interferase family)